MNNNYLSHKGTIVFFNNSNPPALPPGAAYWRRPKGTDAAHTPQIMGEYCTDSLENLYKELANEREKAQD